jgi:HEPN domain-containing protein
LEAFLFNPCLQKCQQAIEKGLKALILSKELPVIKTHKIKSLIDQLGEEQIFISINDQEITMIGCLSLIQPAGKTLLIYHGLTV